MVTKIPGDKMIEELKELKELIEKSMREHDLPYQRKQSLIWGVATAIGFLITQILFFMALDDKLSGFEILPFWIILLLITTYISKRIAGLPEVRSYFSKLYSDFWKVGFFVIVICIFLGLLIYPRYTGAFVAPIVGLMISIAGIMFKVRYTILMGLIYSSSSVAMAIFWQYQFLIFAVMQFITLALPNISVFKTNLYS